MREMMTTSVEKEIKRQKVLKIVKNIFVYHTSDWVDTNMMCSSQWIYTAFTRAKSFLSIHTDKYSNISKAIRKNATDEKVTILELLMK